MLSYVVLGFVKDEDTIVTYSAYHCSPFHISAVRIPIVAKEISLRAAFVDTSGCAMHLLGS